MKQAMIFAAGIGTRLKPITDSMPKALVNVGGHPLIYHVVTKLRAVGFERIVVNVHHFADQIIKYLAENDNFGVDIRISDERERLLETGGGIKKALPLFDADSPILIHNVDILSNVDLSLFYEEAKDNDATLLVSQRKTKRYLLFDDAMLLKGWTNIETGELIMDGNQGTIDKDQLTMLAFSGIHVIAPSVFSYFQKMPERFSIMEFYLKWSGVCHFQGYLKEDLNMVDVGKLDALDKAEKFIKEF